MGIVSIVTQQGIIYCITVHSIFYVPVTYMMINRAWLQANRCMVHPAITLLILSHCSPFKGIPVEGAFYL